MFSQIHHSIQGRHIQFFCLTHIEFRIGDLRRTSTKPRIYMNVQVWVQTREGKHYETNGYISNTRTRNRNRQKQSSVTCKWVLAQLRYTWRSHPSTSEFQQRSCIESPSARSSYLAPLISTITDKVLKPLASAHHFTSTGPYGLDVSAAI
jgi:hypothetical protein